MDALFTGRHVRGHRRVHLGATVPTYTFKQGTSNSLQEIVRGKDCRDGGQSLGRWDVEVEVHRSYVVRWKNNAPWRI
jgi:hypothetical protein